jgi:hypothetical protein
MAKKKSLGKQKGVQKSLSEAFFNSSQIRYLTEDYTYDTVYDCDGYGCDSEGICRCSRIENAKVNSVPDFKSSIKYFFKKQSELEQHCIERVLNAMGIYDASNWEVLTCGGYYGEEINGFSFNDSHKAIQKLDVLLALKEDYEKVNFILNLEYGYLLDSIKDKTDWKIKTVLVENVRHGNKDYYQKLNQSKVEDYSKKLESDDIICICKQVDDQYVLIDGYHRFTSLDASVKKIKIIC